MSHERVLVVEDDAGLRSVLGRALRCEDYDVTTAVDGRGCIRTARSAAPDVLILDIGLPDGDGRDVCQVLRAQGVETPILFLTARETLADRLSGFSAGGDDYLVKPFHVAELVARVRGLLRRAGREQRLTVADLSLDSATRTARCEDDEVSLTPTEFRLLAALVADASTVISRADLVDVGWPTGAIVRANTLDQYVLRLRRKLAELGVAVRIETVYGVGYAVR